MRWLLGCVVVFFATQALILLSAVPAGAAPSYMVGTWFGHGQRGDQGAMYIDRMRADGSWRGEYRSCIKGKPVDQVNTGRWSLQGDILTLQVESANGLPMSYTDPYKMLMHSAKAQKYLSLTYNFPFSPQRVADDFQMPSCELIS